MAKKIDPLIKKNYGAVSVGLAVFDIKAAVAFYQKAFGHVLVRSLRHVVDPDGYGWMVGTHKAEPTTQKMKRKMAEQMDSSRPVPQPSRLNQPVIY
jgi:extradiol dioxygenase family protein